MNDAGLVAFGATRDDATSGVFLGDYAHIEAFNSLVRQECLSQHWFRSLEEAEGILEAWKDEYNNDSPLGSLQQMTPARYRAGVIQAQDRKHPETRRSGGSEKG